MRHGLVAGILGAAAMLAPAGPARAATAAEIVAVHLKARCSADPCLPSDPAIAQDAVVSGAIQIKVRASSELGLDQVRLESRFPGEGWSCLERWNPRTATFEAAHDWETPRYPLATPEWGCREDSFHYHGEPTDNGSYQLRVFVQDLTGAQAASAPFALKFDNPPFAPVWSRAPHVETGSSPVVTLHWYRGDERDLTSYVIVRRNPNGSESSSRIDAKQVERSGCGRPASNEIDCSDGGVEGGTYRYRVYSERPSANGGVIRSAAGSEMVVKVAGGGARVRRPDKQSPPPPASPATGASPPPDPTTTPSTAPGVPADPIEIVPDHAARHAPGTPMRRQPVLAAVLLAIVAGGHALRNERIRRAIIREPAPKDDA